MNDHVLNQARLIKLAVFDVDGVMTSGELIYSANEHHALSFHVRDGFGIQMLHMAHIDVAIISGRSSTMLQKRAEELAIKTVIQQCSNKLAALKQIITEKKLHLHQVSYLGDDIPDLPVIKAVGLGMAVADACSCVKKHADGITQAPGGKGAVRELCEIILQAQGQWQQQLDRYFSRNE